MKKNWMRRFLAALVICAMLVSGTGLLLANAEGEIEAAVIDPLQEGFYGMYSVGTTAVYEEMNTDSKILWNPEDGEMVVIREIDEEWREVYPEGYILATSLRAECEAAAEEVIPAEGEEVSADEEEAPATEETVVEETVVEETVAEETVVEETVAEETVVEETVAEETVAEETVAEETVAEETVVEETVAEETVVEETVAEETVAEETVAEETVAEETVAEETVAEETVAEEPVAEETVAEEPVAEEPVVEETVVEEPVVEETVAEETVVEETVAEETVVEETVAEETVAEETVVEETVAEETVVEEPVVEEPVVEEPVVEEPVEEEVVVEEPVEEEVVVEEIVTEEPAAEEVVAEEVTVEETAAPIQAVVEDVEIEDYETALGTAEYETIVLEGDENFECINVRENADGLSAIVADLPVGTAITVVGIEGDWAHVVVNGAEGYIFVGDLAGYIDLPEEETDKTDSAANMKVMIFSSRRTVMTAGEPVYLTSELQGFEGYEIKYQWKCDKHDGHGFQAVEGGDGETYVFEATAESLSWDWKLTVLYR